MHLLGSGLVISHWKDSDDREEKKKKEKRKNESASFNFNGWTSLGVSHFEAYPTQYCCNLRARCPGSGCISPGKLRPNSLLEIESPSRLKHVGLLRIGSLGRSRHVDLLGPLDWQIPEQVEA